MSTVAERQASLAADLLPVLARYGLEREDLLARDLAAFMSGAIAREAEKIARRDDRWVPRKQRREDRRPA